MFISFWSLWFVALLWLLMLDMVRLTTSVYCCNLVIRGEVGGWQLRIWFVISMWASSSSDSESKASTISFLLWIFGFDGICVSCCFIVLLFLLFLLKLGYKVKIKHTHLHTFGLLFQCKHLQHLIQSQRHLQSHFYDGYSVLMLFVCLVVLLFLFLVTQMYMLPDFSNTCSPPCANTFPGPL